MRNEITKQEIKDSWLWIIVGGSFALFVALFTFSVDRYLSTSDSEQRLGATLKEIRSAQASLPSQVDARQLGTLVTDKRMAELDK
jgi:hypothetical protein